MEVAGLAGLWSTTLTACAGGRLETGSEGLPDGIKAMNGLGIPADHETEAAVQAVDPTARSDIDQGDALGSELLPTQEIVFEKRVPTVDDHIPG
jgi:hypothetical protein